MRGGTDNIAVVGSTFFWRHLHRRFSSSSSSHQPHESKRFPQSTRRKSSNARSKSTLSRSKSKSKAKPKASPDTRSSSPAALLEGISTIFRSAGAVPSLPALATAKGRERGEDNESSFICGQSIRQNAPAGFHEMSESAEENWAECSVDGASARAEDIAPTVQKITEIVRSVSSHGAKASMEDRLMGSDVVFTPEVVEMVLKRCFKAGHSALRFFKWARHQPWYRPSTAAYNAVIYTAGEAGEFDLIEKLLRWMEEDSCPMDVKTWTILVRHYGRAKQIGQALWSFEQIKRRQYEPDRMAYDAVIRASCHCGKSEIAVEFYKEMVGHGIGVDAGLYQVLTNCLAAKGDLMMVRSIGETMMQVVSENAAYSCMLKSFCISGRIEAARDLSDEIKKKNLMLGPANLEMLVKGLCKTGRVAEALEILADDAEKEHLLDNRAYGNIVGGYLKLGDVEKALELLRHIKDLGSLPSLSTYTEVIQHLFRLADHKRACELYEEMLGDGIQPDTVAVMAVVAGHVRSGQVSEAWKVFEDMKTKGQSPTWKAYSVFIRELCKASKPEEAFKLVLEMIDSNINPRREIFRRVVHLLRAKGEAELAGRAEQMCAIFDFHTLEEDGDRTEPSSVQEEESKAVDRSFSEPHQRQQSDQTNERIADSDVRDVCKILSSSSDWTSTAESLKRSAIHFTPHIVEKVLRSCQRQGRSALQFFSWVGKLPGYTHTTETYNIAIKIAGGGKDFSYMRHLHQEMNRRGCPATQATWTIMITQYGRAGLTGMALRKFTEMKAQGCSRSDGVTYKFLIMFLCGKKGRKLPEAMKLFEEMIRAGYLPDKELAQIYLSCLCETGKIEEARECVRTLREKGFAAQAGYSLLVKCLCRAGRLDEALELAGEIDRLGCRVDQYIYGSLVHGLLRGGRQEEALSKMEEMREAGIQPTVHVYTALMVHFFREKQVRRAVDILKKMEEEDGLEPTVVTWSAVIRGYMSVGMIDDAWEVFDRMLARGPLPDFHTYSMLISCLCKSGRSEEGLRLVDDMVRRGIWPSTVNLRTVWYGLNREGKQALASSVLRTKWRLARERKFSA